MSREPWLLAMCVVAGVGIGPREAEASQPDPVITIKVENANGLEGVNLLRVQELTTGIYAQAGVTLHWIADEVSPTSRTLIINLTTTATAPSGIAPESMGVAPSPGDGKRGTKAYVFMDRVTSFTAEYRVQAEYVLACALAHEIGHLLLPPNAHDSIGIMRGSWYPGLFPPRAPGIPGFPPAQARLLRLRAASR